MSNTVIRYSDAELAEFKALIDKKMSQTKENLEGLQAQIQEITENSTDNHGGDWVDDSSTNSDIEMLSNMAIRQRRYLKDLENALIRIQNKVYGICVLTGELIDKKRLMAVPTTTKSLSAKTEVQNKTSERPLPRPKPTRANAEKKIISKVIRKPSTNAPNPILSDDDDDDLDFEKDIFLDEDLMKPSAIDIEDMENEQDDDIDTTDDNDIFITHNDDDDDDLD